MRRGDRVRLERHLTLGGTDPEATGPLHWGVTGEIVVLELDRRLVLLRPDGRVLRTSIVRELKHEAGRIEVTTAHSVYRIYRA